MISLKTKLGLYLALPLIFQVGLSITFALMLERAEQMIIYEYRSKESIASTNWLYATTSNLILSWLASQLSGKPEYRTIEGDFYEKFDEQIPKFKRFINVVPGQKQTTAELELLLKNIKAAISKAENNNSLTPQNKAISFVEGPVLTDYWTKGNLLRRKILETERDIHKIEPEDTFAFRRELRFVMLGGLGFFILLSVSSVFFYGSTLGKRIDALKKNAELLAQNSELNPEVGGNDEIGLFDVTFHNMAKALREAALRERAIIENARDVICSLSCELRFASANRALSELVQAEPDEILNAPISNFVDQIDMESASAYFKKVKADLPDHPLELKLKARSGAEIYTIWSVVWFDDLQSYFCVVHDMTTRKKLEKMRQEIVNMVTHDIRSPLTTVQGLIQFLDAGHLGELNDRGKRMVKNAELSADRIMSLINDFLDTERLESGNFPMFFDDFKVCPMIEDALASVAGLAEKKVVALESLPSDLMVTCDRDRIVQVLVNLISNAVKFSSENQTVTVSAVQTDKWVEFRVQDRGRGIPADQTSSVFEKFKQVSSTDSRNMGGTGLGLSICKSIVEQHSGQIGVNSALGEGSTFWFKLPSISNK